jgi:flagellar biosynthetic protein FlhB
MSGDNRTEKPTPKRRGEARKRGQVAKSPEINSAAVLVATVASLVLFGPYLLRKLENVVRVGLEQAGDPRLASEGGLAGLTTWGLRSVAVVAAPVVAAALVAGVLANVAQVKLQFSPLALKPTFSKLNPMPGLKRMAGKDGWVEAAKASIKTLVIGAVAFFSVWPRMSSLAGLTGLPPAALVHELAFAIRDLAIRVAAAFALIAIADYAWQRRRHESQLRMTKEEVKQELRQTDLAPELKRAIKRRQFEAARRRMLAAVPTADVVVVNPTHFAVALRYDGSTSAPEVIAKGADLVAAAIRKVADEHEVPIVQNAPLARSLYREVELGQQIPEQFFQAVAEVLAFVFRTARRRRRPDLKRRARKPITGPNALRRASP